MTELKKKIMNYVIIKLITIEVTISYKYKNIKNKITKCINALKNC